MASQTSRMTRPDYINSYINQLANQVGNTSSGDYVNLEYAGMNAAQKQALEQLAQSQGLGALSSQYLNAGQQGIQNMASAYDQFGNMYNQGPISADQVSSLANQLYDDSAVQAAIDATNQQTQEQLARHTQPQIAQQYGGQAGFGSGGKMVKDFAQQGALNQMQSNASDITNQAYNTAINQAQSILSGNRQNQAAALSGLAQTGGTLANYGTMAGDISQQAIMNKWNAGYQQQMNQQNIMDNNYQNAINNQNWGYQDIQNQLGAAGVLNSALGQQTTTKTSGGGSGIFGGMMSGAAAGSAFGPWGALAGAAIGGVASASQ